MKSQESTRHERSTRIFFLCISALLLLASSIALLAQITTQYDEFKQHTIVSYKTPRSSVPRMHVFAIKEALASDPQGKYVIVTFIFDSDEWQYLECHNVEALADSTPVDVGESEHDGDVGDGYVMEFVTVEISRATLKRLAFATATKFRICGDVYPLTPEIMSNLRELYKTISRAEQTTEAPKSEAAKDAPSSSVAQVPAPAPPATPPIEGRVAKVTESNLYVSLGSSDGVSQGDEFTIYHIDKQKVTVGTFKLTKIIGEHISLGTTDSLTVGVGDWVVK